MDITKNQLAVSDIRIMVHLGCTTEEQKSLQEVSCVFEISLKKTPIGATSDCLSDTICYHELVQHIEQYCRNETFHLIEAMAVKLHTKLASILRNNDHGKNIQALSVTVKKLSVPIKSVKGFVSFTYCNHIYESENI